MTLDLTLERCDREFARLSEVLSKIDDRVTVDLEMEQWDVMARVDHPTFFAPQLIKLYELKIAPPAHD